jgi:hypothetical protein
MELSLHNAYVVSTADPILPFQLEDAARPVRPISHNLLSSSQPSEA